ncbi:MAG: type I pullulanase [Elusimicrobiaceae bacterium]|nr:type I pullulanase [Elusimicrobiaceae bacterium]
MRRTIYILLAALCFFSGASAQAKNIKIHYNRHAADYDNWKLWAWNATDSGAGFDLSAVGRDEFGLLFGLETEEYGLHGKKIGFLPRVGDWIDKDGPDRYYQPDMAAEVYIFEGEPGVYTNPPEIVPEIRTAFLDTPEQIRVVFSSSLEWKYFATHPISIAADDGPVDITSFEFSPKGERGRVVTLTVKKRGTGASLFELARQGRCSVSVEGLGTRALVPGRLLDSEYFYSDARLGVVKENGAFAIRVFSPAASAVTVLLARDISSGTAVQEIPMSALEHGLWQARISEDIRGRYYQLRVTRGGITVDGLDPYSRSNTAHNGWSLIIDDKTPVAAGPDFDNSENIVYELHLRDMTIDPASGVKYKGKYRGLAESGTRYAKNPALATGLDHLVELGVNVAHIMPVQDFENDESSETYNWGYMPVHFNSPDGWYATRTDDESRVRELKQLVDALHKKGIKVVLDVVYNHTAEGNPAVAYGFNALAEDYYYRTKDDGSYWDGSGCGNEFRSESRMGRKFLLDSLEYWVSEYRIDGFRFDLMGLIDLETITLAVKRLRAINPNIFIYGEPWAAGATPIAKTEKGDQRGKGFAVFNDDFRNAVKGSVFDLKPGYVQAGLYRDEVMQGIRGSIDTFASSPLESINYVSCHDNHTLFDRISLTEDIDVSTSDRIKMDLLANGIILTSQGLPFLHAGEEMLRTKKGEHNSYNLGDDINMIDWSRKAEFGPVFDYYRGLIALRKAHPALRMKTAGAVRGGLKFYDELGLYLKKPCIGYVLDGKAAGDSWARMVVLINPGAAAEKFALPQRGKFRAAVFDGVVSPAGSAQVYEGVLAVPARSMAVLFETE